MSTSYQNLDGSVHNQEEPKNNGSKPQSGQIPEGSIPEIVETPTNRQYAYEFDNKATLSHEARPTFDRPDMQNMIGIEDSVIDENAPEEEEGKDEEEEYMNYQDKEEEVYDEPVQNDDEYGDEYDDEYGGEEEDHDDDSGPDDFDDDDSHADHDDEDDDHPAEQAEEEEKVDAPAIEEEEALPLQNEEPSLDEARDTEKKHTVKGEIIDTNLVSIDVGEKKEGQTILEIEPGKTSANEPQTGVTPGQSQKIDKKKTTKKGGKDEKNQTPQEPAKQDPNAKPGETPKQPKDIDARSSGKRSDIERKKKANQAKAAKNKKDQAMDKLKKKREKGLAKVRAAVRKRKEMRFVYYLLIIALIAAGLVCASIFLIMKDRVTFSAGSDISLTMDTCNLWILDHADSSESNPIYLDYRIPRMLDGNNGGSKITVDKSKSTKTVDVYNAFDIDHCYVKLYIKKGTTFGSLKISCPNCNIVQDSEQMQITNALTISGKSVNATFKDVKAGSFDYSAVTGYVQLSHVDAPSANNKIKISRTGDIIVQSTKTMKIKGTSDTRAFCLSGPSVVQQSITTCTSPSTNCQFEHDICDTAGCTPAATWTITSALGNIYSNYIPKKSGIIDSTYQTKKGDAYDTGIELDPSSGVIVKNFDVTINDTSKNSPQIVLNLGNIQSKSSHFSKWVLSSNPSYAYMKPWWVSIFSATILKPYREEISGFLLPGFCPYYPQYTQSNLLSIQQLLDQNITNENVLITFVNDNDLPLPPTTPTDNSGIFTYSESRSPWDHWYSLYVREDKSVGLVDNDINQKLIILFAIIVSLLIAVYVTFLLTEITIIAINMMYYKVVEFANHVANYSKLDKTKLQIQLEKKEEEEKGGKDKKANQDITTANKKYTLRNIMKYAPSLSAFIDYLSLILYRQFSNSVDQFYRLLFKEVEAKKTMNEAPDPQKDALKGTEAKVLYEKFCFMNHLVEQRLTDKPNTRILKTYGFDIISKDDILSDVFTKINIKSHDNILVQLPGEGEEEISSLKVYMEKNVEITEFEEDQVEVDYFIKLYYNFCDYNRLPKVIVSPTLMKSEFNIDKKSVPQQFIMRKTNDEEDEEFRNPDRSFIQKLTDVCFACTSRKRKQKVYEIDTSKIKDHFALLSDKIDELSDDALQRATVDLILYKGWWIWDFLTVVFHMLVSGAVTVPLILLVIIMECQYSPYSMKNPDTIILASDLARDPGRLLQKLFMTFGWNIAIVIIVCIFWVMSFFDTVLYYCVMEFPQDKSFKRSEQGGGNFLQKLSRRFEWTLILMALAFYFGYIGLILVWLLLGAIINPNVFLPFTSAAVTFVTFVKSKYTEFKNVSKNGTKAVMAYLDKVFGGIISKVINKISTNLEKAANFATDKGKALLKTKAFSTVAGKLTETGIIDQNTMEEFTQKVQSLDANTIIAGATAVALDPSIVQKQVESLAQALKDKAIQKVKEEALKRGIPPALVDLVIAVLMKDKQKTKDSLKQVLNDCADKKYSPREAVDCVIEILYPQSINKEETVMFVTSKIMKLIFNQYGLQYISGLTPEVMINLLKNLKNLQDLKFEVFIRELKPALQKASENYYSPLKPINPFLPTLDILAVLAKEKPEYWKLKDPSLTLLKNSINLIAGEQAEQLVDNFTKFLSLISSGYEVMYQKDKNDIKGPPKAVDAAEMFQIVTSFVKSIGIDKDFLKNIKINYNKDTSEKLIPSLLYLIISYIKQETHDLPTEVIKEFESLFNISSIGKNKFVPFCFNLVNAIYDKPHNFFQRINQSLANYSLHPEMQAFIKIISCYCTDDFATFYKKSINIERNSYFKEISKSMKIEPEEFLGLINIIYEKQDANSDAFFRLILNRMHISEAKLPILKLVMDVFLSHDETTILKACKELNLDYSHLLLASKGLYNPAFIPAKHLQELGIKEDLIKQKATIFNQTDEDYEYWKSEIRGCVGAELNLNDMKDEDAKIMQEKINLVKAYFLNWDTATYSKKNVAGLIDILNNQQNDLKKILTSYDQDSGFNGIDFLCTILAISELKLKKKRKYEIIDKEKQMSIKTICEFMNVKEESLEMALKIFVMSDNREVVNAIISFHPNESENRRVMKRVLDYSTKQVGIIRNQTDFITKELPEAIDLSNLLRAKKDATDANAANAAEKEGEHLNIPAGLFKKLFFSYAKVGVNDMLEFANLILRKIGFPDDVREEFMIKCYQLGLFARGLLSDATMESVLLIKGISFKKIFKLFTIKDSDTRYSEITDFIHDQDHPIKIFIATYALLFNKNIAIKTHNVENPKTKKEKIVSVANAPKQYLARIFNISPVLFDLFEVIQERDISKFIEKGLPLLRMLIGTSLIDVNMIETIFSLAFAEHFNPAYLSKKLDIPGDMIVFFVTLLRLSVDSTRKKELNNLPTSISFKNVCQTKLKVQIPELTALSRLIFNIFDNENAITEIIQNLNLADKIEIDRFKGIVAINKPIDPKLSHNRNRVEAEKLKNRTRNFFTSLNLNVDYGFIIARLVAGDFLVLRESRQFMDWAFPSDDPVAEEALRNLTMGICGLLNHNTKVTPELNADVDRYVAEYYPHRDDFNYNEPDYSSKKDDKSLPNNSLGYAIYLTYHTLDIAPQWIQMFFFDKKAYGEVKVKMPTMTEEFLLSTVLNFIHMPETARDLFGALEWRTAAGKWHKEETGQEPPRIPVDMTPVYEWFASRFTFEYDKVSEFAQKSNLMEQKEFWKLFDFEAVYYKGINSALFSLLCTDKTDKEEVKFINKEIIKYLREPTFDFLDHFIQAEKHFVEKKQKEEEDKKKAEEEKKKAEEKKNLMDHVNTAIDHVNTAIDGVVNMFNDDKKEEPKPQPKPEEKKEERKLEEWEIQEQKKQKRIAVGKLVHKAVLKVYETIHTVFITDKNYRSVRIPGYNLTNMSMLGTIVQMRSTEMDYTKFLYNIHQLWINIERKLFLEDPFYKMSKFKMMKISALSLGHQISNIVEFCLPASYFTNDFVGEMIQYRKGKIDSNPRISHISDVAFNDYYAVGDMGTLYPDFIEYRDSVNRLLNAEDWDYIQMTLGLADKYFGDVDAPNFGCADSVWKNDSDRFGLYKVCNDAEDIQDRIFYSKEMVSNCYENWGTLRDTSSLEERMTYKNKKYKKLSDKVIDDLVDKQYKLSPVPAIEAEPQPTGDQQKDSAAAEAWRVKKERRDEEERLKKEQIRTQVILDHYRDNLYDYKTGLNYRTLERKSIEFESVALDPNSELILEIVHGDSSILLKPSNDIGKTAEIDPNTPKIYRALIGLQSFLKSHKKDRKLFKELLSYISVKMLSDTGKLEELLWFFITGKPSLTETFNALEIDEKYTKLLFMSLKQKPSNGEDDDEVEEEADDEFSIKRLLQDLVGLSSAEYSAFNTVRLIYKFDIRGWVSLAYKLIPGSKPKDSKTADHHPFVILLKSLDLKAIKKDIRNDNFKGYFNYLTQKPKDSRDKVLSFFEDIVLSLDVVKNNKKIDQEGIKGMFKIVRSVLELNFDELFDVLVLPELEEILNEGAANAVVPEKKKLTMIDQIYELFGGNSKEDEYVKNKKILRIFFTLASNDLKTLREKPNCSAILNRLVTDLTETHFLSLISKDPTKQRKIAQLLFGALVWDVELIIKAFITEHTIQEAYLITNLFSCMKLNKLFSADTQKLKDTAQYALKVLFSVVFKKLSSKAAAKSFLGETVEDIFNTEYLNYLYSVNKYNESKNTAVMIEFMEEKLTNLFKDLVAVDKNKNADKGFFKQISKAFDNMFNGAYVPSLYTGASSSTLTDMLSGICDGSILPKVINFAVKDEKLKKFFMDLVKLIVKLVEKFFTKEGHNIDGEKVILPLILEFLNSSSTLLETIKEAAVKNAENEKDEKKKQQLVHHQANAEKRVAIWNTVKLFTPNLMKMYLSFQTGGKEKVPIKVTVLAIVKDILSQKELSAKIGENCNEILFDILSILIGTNVKEWDETKEKKLRTDLSPADRLQIFFTRILPKIFPDLQYYLSVERFEELYNIIVKLDTEFLKSLQDPQKLKEVLLQIAQLLSSFGLIDPKLIQSVLAVMNGNFEASEYLITTIVPGSSEQKVKQVIVYLKDAKKLIGGNLDTLNKLALPSSNKQENVSSDAADQENWNKIMAKIKSGEASPKDLFQVVDMAGDKSGTVSEDEFHMLANRLGLKLTKHRIKEIFAKVKGNKAKGQESLELNEKEFEKALDYLQEKNLNQALQLLGITPEILTAILIRLIILLLLIFVFVFLGIQSFAIGGTFGAIINSLFPAAGGAGLGKKSDDKQAKLNEENVTNAADNGLSITASQTL